MLLNEYINSYLKHRDLLYKTESVKFKIKVTSVEVQLVFQDINYDKLLNIDMPTKTQLVGCGDNIATLIAVKLCWLDSHGLKLATERTQLIVITFSALTDLTSYTQYSSNKANKIDTYLNKIIANIFQTENKRIFLMIIAQIILSTHFQLYRDIVTAQTQMQTIIINQFLIPHPIRKKAYTSLSKLFRQKHR